MTLIALAIIVPLLMSTFGGQAEVNATAVAQTQTASTVSAIPPTPKVTPSITALPIAKQGSASYAAGRITLIRIENPTNRPVTFGNYSEEKTLATPAVGSQFVALQIDFKCGQAICENPPEADLALQLSDGKIVQYQSSRPFLQEQPAMSRVSNNQSVRGWIVFEVSTRLSPATLVIMVGEETVGEINLPKD